MERSIPHVLDVFESSPGEQRRPLARERRREPPEFPRELKNQQKNPSSDSAVCLCSSSDEDERNISKFFDYLNDDDENTFPLKKKKARKGVSDDTGTTQKGPGGKDEAVKPEQEKDIKQIEKHLSMKKTIRKKMMRDLQQAFVEDPGEFEQDPSAIPIDRKNIINIHNLTMSKGRLSKSEHNFLDMLKETKLHRIGLGSHGPSSSEHTKDHKSYHGKHRSKYHSENDSGNDSPTRKLTALPSVKLSRDKIPSTAVPKQEKASLWQRLTGKGKSKKPQATSPLVPLRPPTNISRASSMFLS